MWTRHHGMFQWHVFSNAEYKQQQESGGYVFICSDEGERFLSLVNQKQRQGESERALLCKMWQGKGDMSALSTGNRRFKATSVYPSTCRPVYPSTCLPDYPSTYLPVYGSLLLKHLSSRQGESKCALLCYMWQCKEICLHCLQETRDLRRHLSTCLSVDLSTRLPVYPSTYLPVDLSTCLPVDGSLLLKHLSSRQGESERALLCKMWQGKGDISALSTGNRGFKETYVYLSTCLPVYPSSCLPVGPSTCLPVYPSTCRPVDLSTVPYF